MTLTLGAAEREREALNERLLKVREPLNRIQLLAGFVCRTFDALNSRDLWPEFVGPTLLEMTAHSSVSRLLQQSPAQLSRLLAALAGVASREETRRLFSDLRRARHSQAIFAGDAAYLAAECGIDVQQFADCRDPLDVAEVVAANSGSGREEAENLLRQWRAQHSAAVSDRVNVLLVLHGNEHWPAAGVLSALALHDSTPQRVPVVHFAHTGETVGSGTVALDSAMQAAMRWISKAPSAKPLSATLTLSDVHDIIEGPSLGLAIAALCIANSIANSPARVQYRIRGSVALTGALDADGRVHPVEGLREKVERAFYSPLEFVAVPAAQEEQASAIVAELRVTFPLRRLGIIPVRDLDDLFYQRRLVSEHVVPLPVHVAHQAARLPRWALALLAVAILLFAGVSTMWYYYPLTRPWQDRTPFILDATNGETLRVYNQDHEFLWQFTPGGRWMNLNGSSDPTRFVSVATNAPGIAWTDTSTSPSVGSPFVSQFADLNSDGTDEIVFALHGLESTETPNPPTILYCLNSRGKKLWEYHVTNRSTPFCGADVQRRMQLWRWCCVDWSGGGSANIVLGICDADGSADAGLIELDGRTGRELEVYWHRQWFFSMRAVPKVQGNGEQLWAGTLDDRAHPELFVFEDSIRSGVWPEQDTSRYKTYRFPICDVYVEKNKAGWVVGLNWVPPDSTVSVHIANSEVHKPSGGDWLGYSFRVDHRMRWIPEPMANYQVGFLEEFVRAGIIPRTPTPDDWYRPNTWAEIWTGREWVPVDTISPPDPYPFYNDSTRARMRVG